jgi:hypothetical protein
MVKDTCLQSGSGQQHQMFVPDKSLAYRPLLSPNKHASNNNRIRKQYTNHSQRIIKMSLARGTTDKKLLILELKNNNYFKQL